MRFIFTRKYLSVTLIAIGFLASSFIVIEEKIKPTLFLIGDSTVKNGKGNGDGSLWGWGSFLADFFDTDRITIENHALGGTSSRTYQTNGLWAPVLAKIKKGDYLMIQFGHNDGGALADTARARGSIKGVGTASESIYNPIRKQQEVVYTYGWYLRKFISDAKAKGAIPIICSPIPRNPVKNGKMELGDDAYANWAQEVAQEAKVAFIPLNTLVKENYSQSSIAIVQSYFTEKDHTHTNQAGAQLNASLVAKAVRSIPSIQLKKYLKR